MSSTYLYLRKTHGGNIGILQDKMEVLLLQLETCRRRQQPQQLPPPPLLQPQTPPQHPQRQRRRQERIFWQRTTFLGLRVQESIRTYRLNRKSILCLLHHIVPDITAKLQTPNNIPPITNLLAGLQMLASGSFQTTRALVAGVSQPSFSVFLPKVLDAIICLTHRHIWFRNTQQMQQETKQGSYLIAGFRHVLGAMDCTHVQIVPPAATEQIYRNQKHVHSINVQAIVDYRGLFMNIVAKYPGSIHDAFIFRHSRINERFQDGQYGNGPFVADQGYRIQPWVMTPSAKPNTAEKRAYNEGHHQTPNVVERTFGILKSRFRYLDLTGGSLLYAPPILCKIILTCAILHNICVQMNVPLDNQFAVPPEEEEDSADDLEGGTSQNSCWGTPETKYC
ncbi:putative nuclease HARBI1 [Pleurodeles waltl]|uniref:putative nuclease HARBI1 n=1 Tax=Pleurodeles waltl TaxID=8319 RepID=UPI003709AA9A